MTTLILGFNLLWLAIGIPSAIANISTETTAFRLKLALAGIYEKCTSTGTTGGDIVLPSIELSPLSSQPDTYFGKVLVEANPLGLPLVYQAAVSYYSASRLLRVILSAQFGKSDIKRRIDYAMDYNNVNLNRGDNEFKWLLPKGALDSAIYSRDRLSANCREDFADAIGFQFSSSW